MCKAIKRCRSTADTSHNYNSQAKSGVKGCLIYAVVMAARYIPLLSTASPEVWLVIPKIQPYVWPFIIKTQLNEAAESCSYYNVKSKLVVGIKTYVKLMDSPLLYASAFIAWKVFPLISLWIPTSAEMWMKNHEYYWNALEQEIKGLPTHLL